MPRLGFGAMRITGDGIWGDPPDPAAARRLLQRAVALGVRFIDTADSYGPEVSERLIAEALHPVPGGPGDRDQGRAVRPDKPSWDRDARPAHLRAACEASLRRLRLERIDLYQLHAIGPARAARGFDRRTRAPARRGQDPPRRRVQLRASRNSNARAASCPWSRSRTATTSPTAARIRCSRSANVTGSRSSRGRPLVQSDRATHGRPARLELERRPPGAAGRCRRPRSPGCSATRRRCCRSRARLATITWSSWSRRRRSCWSD